MEGGESGKLDTLDNCGGSGNVEGDTKAELENITSHSTTKGTVPTDEVAMGNIYAQVDLSKKKPKKGKGKGKWSLLLYMVDTYSSSGCDCVL